MLRPYQRDILDQIPDDGNTLICLPTGSGKTYTFTTYIREMNLPTCVMAHRNELVGQMSLSLAHAGIPHRVLANDASVSSIAKAHRQTLGRCLIDPSASTICASVDTLVRRSPGKSFDQIRLWVIDEAHHVLLENKWGKAASMFRNARGLGVTATPVRADGKGLGRNADGLFDRMIEGPSGDDLIDMGYLSPYELIGPPATDVDWKDIKIGASGDYVQKQLAAATKSSRTLTGDVVGTYLSRAANKLGIVFCVDIEHAEDITQRLKQCGVPAALVTARTPLLERISVMEKFRKREILVLVNVDLFGEGVDVPAVEIVIMARKTASFPLYSQQFGRALRPVYTEGMPLDTPEQRKHAIACGPKPVATIIDHVDNWRQHLLPTSRRRFTLERGEKKGASNVDSEYKLKGCANPACAKPYRAVLDKCPYCGHKPDKTPREGTKPEEVDGDLELIDLDLLRELQQRAERIMQPSEPPYGASRIVALSVHKKGVMKRDTQRYLRNAIAQWAGWKKQDGLSTSEIQKLFYLKFRTDVLTAQTLGHRDADTLLEEVTNDIEKIKRSCGAE